MTLRYFQVQKGHSTGSVDYGMENKMTCRIQLKYDTKSTENEIKVKCKTNASPNKTKIRNEIISKIMQNNN